MSARVYSQRQDRVTGHVYPTRDSENLKIQGHVTTPQGIVIAFARDDGIDLHMVYAGRYYVLRDTRCVYTARGLTTVAGRFARDVAAGRYEG